ncbi:MAG: carbohydrate-binding domain-containing protein [Clostridia bacterium]|nr:carbohydrate-binding domain-containing protein [Clostridia bacterium]
MKNNVLILLLALVLLLSSVGFAQAETTASGVRLEDYFSGRDLSGEWDEDEAKEIALTESLTITEAGVYVLSGTIADGTVTIDVASDEKVQLVLNGVSITCSNSACIFVKNADKVFITLAEGTENTLTSNGFDENGEIDGAVFSKDDITLNGEGTLTVTSAKHGIAGKDDVKFGGGAYVIHAGERGITGKDSVRVFDGSYTIYSGKTPIRSKNKDAGKGYVLILGGFFYLYTDAEDGED